MNSTATVQAAVRETTQVEDALQCTRISLDETGNIIEELDKCLVSVLHEEPPSDLIVGESPKLVPLAEEIQTIRKRIDSCNARLRSWLRRIEIAG